MFVGEAALAEGLRIYAIGDIHGRADLLDAVLHRIEADLADNPVPSHKIITLGDYCDRGPDSATVIERLAALSADPEIICLMGNHDQKMLEFMEVPEEVAEPFLIYGGLQTLQSYGVDIARADTWANLSRAFIRRVPRAHKRFLGRLSLMHVEGDYLFVHAGLRPGIPIDRQSPDDLLWIREEFLLHQGSFGKVVVHGHTPYDRVDIQSNRINIDTRAYESGVLTCLVLEKTGHRLIQTGTE